jgi:predicted nucleic acid-binding protein
MVLPQLSWLPVDDANHCFARKLIERWSTTLRAGDGLHLAIASANGATVYTLDRKLSVAGSKLGVPVVLI